MKIFLSKALLFFILFPCIYSFGVILPHQGRVSVSGTPFDGNASFQFALVDQAGNIVWNHEGGTVSTDPTSVLTLEVINGFYKCNLGDNSFNGMASLSTDLFDINNQLSLRIWFDDGINGLEQLGTDQPLHVAPYALSASYTRTPADLISSQLGESISSQASASGISESNLTNRISLLAANASDTGQITSATIDPTLLNDLNRTRESNDIADGNITKEKLSSTLLEYLKPKLISSPSLPTESGGVLYRGQSLILSVEAEGRNLSYQWQKNGVDLSAGTSATYTITQADPSLHDGNYSVVVSNIFGNISTSGVILSIIDVNSSFAGQTFHVKSAANMELIWVPSGSFLMGSPVGETGRFGDDEIEHNVSITNGFFLGKFEVTQAQYFSVLGGNPSDFINSQNPVENVSWLDVNSTFLPILNEQEQTNGNLPVGWNYVLPTEAEWEYACRAGSTTAYSFGNSISSSLANYSDYYSERTSLVGSFSQNTFGFYDMHGNVSEWVNDWVYYDILDAPENFYTDANQSDPLGPSSGTNKIIKGGSHSKTENFLRSAAKDWGALGAKDNKIGFRLALKKSL